ncbi:hypothetical protein A8709_25175 [Paenibacillus pectinilyticus]|uniref:Uncharacterized protein n=1 Tax=Paenibacillus pectinilyticus TaxID=512399 RepID=A0A1C1A0U1_9BACL|nr:hypothetical protein [Paenibacillus pectinilyticus]OCT14142.1 hypothetical protein A8709_25175 [Paenibacillus pectinilyticus]
MEIIGKDDYLGEKGCLQGGDNRKSRLSRRETVTVGRRWSEKQSNLMISVAYRQELVDKINYT